MRHHLRYTKIAFIALILFCTSGILFSSEPGKDDFQIWSSGTAYLLAAGRWEIGVFQPLRYGYSENLEFSTHPVVFFIIPNLNAKWSHHPIDGFDFATQHQIYYPTLLLRTLSREGTGGIISPEFHIPHMISIYNEMVLSKPIAEKYLITGKIGFNLALKSGTLDDRTTIDLPLVFPRLSVFYHGYGFRSGVDLVRKMSEHWNVLVDADLFFYPNADEDFAFEHKGLMLWNKSNGFQFCAGYKLTFGKYPFGTQWHLLAPIFDVQWGW